MIVLSNGQILLGTSAFETEDYVMGENNNRISLPLIPPNWKNLESVKNTPEIHHYTNRSGLEGIIRSNSLWATHFGDLNDSSEIFSIRQPLTRDLTSNVIDLIRTRRTSSQKFDRMIISQGGLNACAQNITQSLVGNLYASTFSIEDQYEGVPALNAPTFVTSFCNHKDDEYSRENGILSQWRGYGGAGGFCIVFDTDAIFKMLNAEMEIFSYMNVCFDNVNYYNPEGEISGVFPELLISCEAMIDHLFDNRNQPPDDIFEDFILAASLAKHHGFHEEREFRIAIRPATTEWRAEIEKLERWSLPGQKSVEQMPNGRRKLTLFGQDFQRVPIKRIIVGPGSTETDSINFVRQLCENKIPIHQSVTPYSPQSWV